LTRIIEKRLSLQRNVETLRRGERFLAEQVDRLQPLANIGVAASMVAHELNNLLTTVGSYAELALQNPDDRNLAEKALGKAVLNCRRAAEISSAVLSLANAQCGDKKNFRLCDLLREVFDSIARDFEKDRITVRLEVPADMTVFVSAAQIQQVLMNLILNAREAMLPSGGVLTVAAGRFPDHVRVDISDTGHGISGADIEKIFEPFFSTKRRNPAAKSANGRGLGLAFCRRMVQAHGGNIGVKSEPGKGSTFTITLPESPAAKI